MCFFNITIGQFVPYRKWLYNKAKEMCTLLLIFCAAKEMQVKIINSMVRSPAQQLRLM